MEEEKLHTIKVWGTNIKVTTHIYITNKKMTTSLRTITSLIVLVLVSRK